MKKIIAIIAAKAFVVMLLAFCANDSMAQKFVFVDTEYLLKNIPAYESANEQLSTLSKKYEAEIKAKMQEVETLYETYRTESVFFSSEMKIKKENEIIEKEQAAKKLQQTYFGEQGEFFKQREALVKPIQDQIYNAIEAIAKEKNYGSVFDKSSNIGLMYNDSSLDISDQVLARLGYRK